MHPSLEQVSADLTLTHGKGRTLRVHRISPLTFSFRHILFTGQLNLDALPYIDGEMDPDIRARVDQLILEEMRNPRFPKRSGDGLEREDPV